MFYAFYYDNFNMLPLVTSVFRAFFRGFLRLPDINEKMAKNHVF